MFPRLLIHLLVIRFKQFFRLFNGIDFIRLFFSLGIAAVVGFMLFGWSSNREYIKPWILVHTILFISIHISRNDKQFIKMITHWPYMIFFTEYFLLSLPVFISFIIHENWTGLILVPILFIISVLNLTITFSFSGIIKLIMSLFRSGTRMTAFNIPGTGNPLLFEWNSGIRSSIFFIGFIYLVIAVFSFTGYVAHIGMIVLSVLISSFYFRGEPRIFIEQFSSSPKQFLLRKISLNIKYLTIIFLPILIISLLFQTRMWYLLLLALFISYAIQLLAILIKYSLFREDADLQRNSLILVISVICLLLPFIWPLPVIVGIRSYRKALKNLNPYFHD